MAALGKGTVTSLSSMFPADEAQKASQHVHDTIAEKRKDLDKLNHFISDNTNLINLVQRLPDELHHHIMVPFGKGAFFPGRLVHTNEFMVLLGEGYYAERTAKQTIDILRRREKTLESQVDSLKAVIEDLKAEASFFDRMAAEAAEGLVEIREEYTDEDSVGSFSEAGQQRSDAPSVSEVDSGTEAVDDEVYARIMSRFDELEKEELEAEDIIEQRSDESEKEELEAGDTEEQDDDEHDEDFNDLVSPEKQQLKSILKKETTMVGNSNSETRRGVSWANQPSPGKDFPKTCVSKPAEKDYVRSFTKTSIQFTPESKSEVPVPTPEPNSGCQISRPVTDSLKAFTGTIIERTDNLQSNPDTQATNQPSNSQPSKPVSRFKMQRR